MTSRFDEKDMYGTRDAASNRECDRKNHLRRWEYKLEQSSKKLLYHKTNNTSRMTHGDDFVVAGPTCKLFELKNKLAGMCPITKMSSVLGRQGASRRCTERVRLKR